MLSELPRSQSQGYMASGVGLDKYDSVRAKILKGQGAKNHFEDNQRMKSVSKGPEAYISCLKGHFKILFYGIFTLSFMLRNLEI